MRQPPKQIEAGRYPEGRLFGAVMVVAAAAAAAVVTARNK